MARATEQQVIGTIRSRVSTIADDYLTKRGRFEEQLENAATSHGVLDLLAGAHHLAVEAYMVEKLRPLYDACCEDDADVHGVEAALDGVIGQLLKEIEGNWHRQVGDPVHVGIAACRQEACGTLLGTLRTLKYHVEAFRARQLELEQKAGINRVVHQIAGGDDGAEAWKVVEAVNRITTGHDWPPQLEDVCRTCGQRIRPTDVVVAHETGENDEGIMFELSHVDCM